MNSINSREEVQRLLAEKEQLKKEEQQLRRAIDLVKKQINALQVEQLVVSNREPLRISPVELNKNVDETFNPVTDLSLDVLNQIMSGTFVAEEEEDE